MIRAALRVIVGGSAVAVIICGIWAVALFCLVAPIVHGAWMDWRSR